MKVSVAEILEHSRAALLAHGAGDWQAEAVARAVARAEETGNVICGLYYLESYCVQLVSGRVDGRALPVVSRPTPGCVRVDACFGFAQPAFARALPLALEAARENGVATLAVAHAHTCTSLGFFTEQIAGDGIIALGMTNASAIVAGPGGRAPVLGTNPFAITIPGTDGPALHADFSTSAVALGRITMAKAAGEPIPLGWAVDADGNPTTDPEAAICPARCNRRRGPRAGRSALMVEAFAAGLTGSVNSRDVKGLKAAEGPPHGLGQFYILIDPGAHDPAFAMRFARMADADRRGPGRAHPGRAAPPSRPGRCARRALGRNAGAGSRRGRAKACLRRRPVATCPAGPPSVVREDLGPRGGGGLAQTCRDLARMCRVPIGDQHLQHQRAQGRGLRRPFDATHQDRACRGQVALMERDARARGLQRPGGTRALGHAARHQIAGAGHAPRRQPCRDQRVERVGRKRCRAQPFGGACAASMSCRPSCVTNSSRRRSGSSGVRSRPCRDSRAVNARSPLFSAEIAPARVTFPAHAASPLMRLRPRSVDPPGVAARTTAGPPPPRMGRSRISQRHGAQCTRCFNVKILQLKLR
jgi:(2R)-3-sulfolactate dehydrogenase (NADP+)